MQLPLLNSEYLVGGYIPTVRDVHLDNGSIRERVKCEQRVQRVFLMDRLWSSDVKKNSFVLFSGIEEKEGG